MAIKYSENMSAEEEKALMAEIEYEDACYAKAAEYDAEQICQSCGCLVSQCPVTLENQEALMEEAAQMDTLRKAALNRGQP